MPLTVQESRGGEGFIRIDFVRLLKAQTRRGQCELRVCVWASVYLCVCMRVCVCAASASAEQSFVQTNENRARKR